MPQFSLLMNRRAPSHCPDLYYTIDGLKRKPVILFLHGFMGDSGDWDGIIDELKGNFRCMAVDLPGHGKSIGLSSECYTIDASVNGLANILDENQIERSIVVGYSMGARVALKFAQKYPARCTGVMLESATPGIEDEAERERRRTEDETRSRAIRSDFDGFLNEWYQQPLFASLGNREDLVKRLIERRRKNNAGELAHAMCGIGTGSMVPMWERLGELSVCTLALTGELDSKYLYILKEMKKRAPQLRVVAVPGAGHIVHLERPVLYCSMLLSFAHNFNS